MVETGRRDFLKVAAASLAAAAAGVFPSLANESECEQNTGMPDPSRHVFIIGDLHLTRKDPYPEMPVLLDSLESLSRGKKGFHLVFNGDFLEFPDKGDHCENAEWQWRQFLVLNSMLSNSGFISHLVFGNHDGPEPLARKLAGDAIPPENMGNSAFSLKNGARIILISGKEPRFFDAIFLRDQLIASPPGHTFVFSHFPPDSMPSQIECLNRRPGYGIIARNPKIARMISSSGATLVSSHLHSPFIGEYLSHLLEKPINVISTPSFSYDLPYFVPVREGKRIFGITALDTSIGRGRAFFFDKDKRFHIPGREVESYHGKYLPGDFSRRRMIPGFPPNQFFLIPKRS